MLNLIIPLKHQPGAVISESAATFLLLNKVLNGTFDSLQYRAGLKGNSVYVFAQSSLRLPFFFCMKNTRPAPFIAKSQHMSFSARCYWPRITDGCSFRCESSLCAVPPPSPLVHGLPPES